MANETDWSKFKPETPAGSKSANIFDRFDSETDWSGFVPEAAPSVSADSLFSDLVPEPKRNAFAYANDFMIDAANAAAGLAKAGVDLVAPGSAPSKAIEGFIESGQQSQSDWKKAQRSDLSRKLSEADGELDKAGTYLKHAIVEDPLGTVAEMAGNLGPFGVAGRALQGANTAVRTGATMGLAGGLTAGEVRGNIHEKFDSTPDAELQASSPEYARLRQTMSEADAKAQLGSSFSRNAPEILAAGAIGALGGKYGLEGMAARVAPTRGRIANAAIGVADEASQGAVEQLASNYGIRRALPDQSLVEDVALNAAAEGILGLGGAAIGPTPRFDPNAGPISRAANLAQAAQSAGALPAPGQLSGDAVMQMGATVPEGDPSAEYEAQRLNTERLNARAKQEARRGAIDLDYLDHVNGWAPGTSFDQALLRMQELQNIAQGTPDQESVGSDGQPAVALGGAPREWTEAEAQEFETLRQAIVSSSHLQGRAQQEQGAVDPIGGDLDGFVPDQPMQPSPFDGRASVPPDTAPPGLPEDAARLFPLKTATAAARRGEAAAKDTGIAQVVIPHPTVVGAFAVVPETSPLARLSGASASGAGLDVDNLFRTEQTPIALPDARNLAQAFGDASGMLHVVVPSPAGTGFGVVPISKVSAAQLHSWAAHQPGARRGAARSDPGPSAAPTAPVTPVTAASSTSTTATPAGTPNAGAGSAAVTGSTPAAAPAAPDSASHPLNPGAARATPGASPIDSEAVTQAFSTAAQTIRNEQWTGQGSRRFAGRVRAELIRAGMSEDAAKTTVALATTRTPPGGFMSSAALLDAARATGALPAAPHPEATPPRTSSTNPAGHDTRPLDHGELNIPGRTDSIDAELDRWKADQAKAQRAQAKTDAATRKAQKAEAQQLFAQLGPAMIEQYTPRFGRKEIERELDSMVKWEPAKFIDLAQRFEAEQAQNGIETRPKADQAAQSDIPASTTTPEAAPPQGSRADKEQDIDASAPAFAPGQAAKGRAVLLAQIDVLKQHTAPADIVADYNQLKDRVADARRRAKLKSAKRGEPEKLTEWADNQDRTLEQLRNTIGFVELKAGSTRYRVLNTPQNLEAFAQKLKKAPIGRWTVTVQPDEIYDNVETRPGTTEAQRERGRSAVAALVARISAWSERTGRGPAQLLGSNFSQSFAATGGTSLVGQKVESAADLAAIAQVLRDPRFETFRVFYTKGTEIVGQAAYSSRLPAAVYLPHDMSYHIRVDKDRFEADGYFVLHNHPSGKATPSQSDLNLTKSMASASPGFRGHVVIDHNEYAVIDAQGTPQVIQAPELDNVDFHSSPELEHELLGVKISSPDTLAMIGRVLQIENGHASVIFTRRQGQAQLIMDLPAALLEDRSSAGVARLKAVVRRMARAAGAGGHRFVVLPADGNVRTFSHLAAHGVFHDVVGANGDALSAMGLHAGQDFLEKNPKSAGRVVEGSRERATEGAAPYSITGARAQTVSDLAALVDRLPTGAGFVTVEGGRVRDVFDFKAESLGRHTKNGNGLLRIAARRATRSGRPTYLLTPAGTDTRALRWLIQDENIADVITADGTSRTDAMQRTQMRVGETPGRYANGGTSRTRNIGDWIRGALASKRPWMLGALTRDQITDIWGRDMPQVIEFDRHVQAMDTDRATIAQAADEIIERWRKLPHSQADALADVMHAATLAGFDPDTMNATNPEHDQILADFERLSGAAQAVYRETRGTHRATLQAIRDGLVERAESAGSIGRRAAAQIRLDFDKYLADGVYFPLSRFGDLLLIADRNGARTVEAFESGAKREARAQALRAAGWTVRLTSKSQYSAARNGAANAFTAQVMRHVDALDIDPGQKASLIDTLNQLAISMLPDASYRKHFAHRKGVPGFSNDAMRGFAQSQQHAAHHIARIRHAGALVDTLDEMQKDVRDAGGDTTEQQQVVNELTRRLDHILNPNTHPVAAAAGQVGFVMSLGGSIASGLVNLTQTPFVTFPWLGARFGFDKASTALTKASRDYFGGKWDRWSGFVLADNPNLSPDERAALEHLQDTGIINLTQAHDLAGTANTDSTVSKRAFAINRAMKIVGWTFHVPEVFNRQVSALATYRLARDKGQAHADAVEAAREALIRTHFDYSASNRARFMQGNFTRVITMFKQYSQQMTYLLWRNAYQALKGESPEVKREARRMLLGVGTMHFAAAGSLGLPLGVFGISPLLSLLAMGFGDDDDPPLDWETEYRLWLADTFGQEAGEAIAHGPARMLLNIDLASRIGLGDLWVHAPLKEAEGRDLVEAWMLTLLGPVAGYAGQMGTAMQAFEEGKFARGVESMMPKFISAPLKAYRYETEGVRSWKGDDLGITLDSADILGVAAGFQPTVLAEMYEGRGAVKGREAALQRRREDLMRAWREAREAGDDDGFDDVVEDIRRFNRKNPIFGIGPQHLKASWMAHRRAQLQMAQGIHLSRRRDELRDLARFAVID